MYLLLDSLPVDIPDIYKDFNKFIAALKNVQPEQNIRDITSEVRTFVESQLETVPDESLLMIENKAKLLFEPFLHRFFEKGLDPVGIRVGHDVIITKGNIAKSKQVSILADSIHTGDEIVNVVGQLVSRNYKVRRIYCFVQNTGATKRLNENKLFDNIEIVSAHKVKTQLGNPDDLIERLKLFYAALPDPTDLDHAYDVYYGDSDCSPVELKKIIEDCCKKAMNTEGLLFEKDDNMILPEAIESMRMNIPNPRLVAASSKPKVHDLVNSFQFEHTNFRLKTFFQKDNLQFSIIGCFIVKNLRRNNINPDNCIVCKKSECYQQIIKCEVRKSLRWKVLCPLCAQNFIERSILNEINTLLTKSLGARARFTVEPHDPFNRKLE